MHVTMAQSGEPHLPPHDVQMIGCDQLDDLGRRPPLTAAFRTTRSDCGAGSEPNSHPGVSPERGG
jgi:hypothetical protein